VDGGRGKELTLYRDSMNEKPNTFGSQLQRLQDA
jgi:hypothetical protein